MRILWGWVPNPHTLLYGLLVTKYDRCFYRSFFAPSSLLPSWSKAKGHADSFTSARTLAAKASPYLIFRIMWIKKNISKLDGYPHMGVYIFRIIMMLTTIVEQYLVGIRVSSTLSLWTQSSPPNSQTLQIKVLLETFFWIGITSKIIDHDNCPSMIMIVGHQWSW